MGIEPTTVDDDDGDDYDDIDNDNYDNDDQKQKYLQKSAHAQQV